MEWPAMSPDLNPIEHVWNMLQRSILDRGHAIESLARLEEALVQAWDQLPQERLRALIDNFPRRCQAEIEARGGHTRY